MSTSQLVHVYGRAMRLMTTAHDARARITAVTSHGLMSLDGRRAVVSVEHQLEKGGSMCGYFNDDPLDSRVSCHFRIADVSCIQLYQ